MLKELKKNPKAILSLDDDYYLDEQLISMLFAHILDVAVNSDNQEFLKQAQKYSELLRQKIAEMKNLKHRGKFSD